MPTIVPDRGNDPKRVPGSYMSEVNKAKSQTPHTPLSKSAMKVWSNETVTGRDNPKWKCESCGKKGAQDYAGQGRVCESCADERGF
jgi:hypothetical protein